MSHKKTIIGVIGASSISKTLERDCEKLGALIAGNGWATLTGGAPVGVMEYTLKGAAEAGGETVGILGGDRDGEYSHYASIPIFTNADIGRDHFNVLTSDCVVVVGKVSAGTLIEVAYALKKSVPLILYKVPESDATFIKKRGGRLVSSASSIETVGSAVKKRI